MSGPGKRSADVPSVTQEHGATAPTTRDGEQPRADVPASTTFVGDDEETDALREARQDAEDNLVQGLQVLHLRHLVDPQAVSRAMAGLDQSIGDQGDRSRGWSPPITPPLTFDPQKAQASTARYRQSWRNRSEDSCSR